MRDEEHRAHGQQDDTHMQARALRAARGMSLAKQSIGFDSWRKVS